MDTVTRIVRLHRDMDALRDPRIGAPVAGRLGARSRYLERPMHVPLVDLSGDGRWGKVRLPWRSDGTTGWIRLRGLEVTETPYAVVVHRARRRIDVMRGDHRIASFRAGIGGAASPTPRGTFFVTDRVTVPAGQRPAFGSYAFGLSGLQTQLPTGWRGGDQLAIHGTGQASSIGRARSAGCVRVSEPALRALRRWLVPGTVVDIR